MALIVIYFIYVVCGTSLVATPFSRRRSRSRWARIVFAIAGVVTLLMGVVGVLRSYGVWLPPADMHHHLRMTTDTLRGLVLGCVLALVVSGELSGRKVSRHDRAA